MTGGIELPSLVKTLDTLAAQYASTLQREVTEFAARHGRGRQPAGSASGAAASAAAETGDATSVLALLQVRSCCAQLTAFAKLHCKCVWSNACCHRSMRLPYRQPIIVLLF